VTTDYSLQTVTQTAQTSDTLCSCCQTQPGMFLNPLLQQAIAANLQQQNSLVLGGGYMVGAGEWLTTV